MITHFPGPSRLHLVYFDGFLEGLLLFCVCLGVIRKMGVCVFFLLDNERTIKLFEDNRYRPAK